MMANGIENFPSRTAFIVTPLLVAFTMLQSNNQAAEALLSGLKVLQEEIRRGSKAPVINEEMERLTCLMLQVYSKENPIMQENIVLPYSDAIQMKCVVGLDSWDDRSS